MQLSRGVAHFPGGTLFADSSGRRFRKNQSTESSAVCVENFRERQDDLYGTCYVPHDPRVRRYGLSAFLIRPLRELDCSKCRSLQLAAWTLLEHLDMLGQFGQDDSWLLVKLFRFKTDPFFSLHVLLFQLSVRSGQVPILSIHELWNSSFSLQMLEMHPEIQCHTATP